MLLCLSQPLYWPGLNIECWHGTYLVLYHKGCGWWLHINIPFVCLKCTTLSPPFPFFLSLSHPSISFHLLPWQLCLVSSTLPFHWVPLLRPLFFYLFFWFTHLDTTLLVPPPPYRSPFLPFASSSHTLSLLWFCSSFHPTFNFHVMFPPVSSHPK